MTILTGISKEVKGHHIELEKDVITIGYSDDNTIVIPNPTVSGRHCSIFRDGKKYRLRDLGSTNGTRVNSKSVKETCLKPKDIIQLGFVEFIFDTDEYEEVEALETGKHSFTEVEIEEDVGPAKAPESFNTISPFGARTYPSKGLSVTAISIMGLFALLFVILFFVKLVTIT